MNIERVMFANLLGSEEYTRKTIPFLREEYFPDRSDRVLFSIISDYFKKYNSSPSIEAVAIELSNREINEQEFKACTETLKDVSEVEVKDLEWVVDQTEKYCQEKAIYNAIMSSIQILDDKTKVEGKGMIPKLLHDALSVSFDTNVGHDFLVDAEKRFDFYHLKEARIPFDLEYFNSITGGGLKNKTLNVVLAGVGVGKSMFMCHCAATNLAMGKNVLYISLEMGEEEIAERIDANLLDVDLDELKTLPRESYDKKISRLRSRTAGKLIIKEYPTACAGSANFRYLIDELKTKKNFHPDIVYIDYLNICSSSRIKMGATVNSYTLVKAIAEELRGLGQEYNLPIFTATQVNRTGFTDSDFGLENVAESFGLPATADLMFALISTEEMEELNQILVKQLKNRYNNVGFNRRFVVGIARNKMRFYNVEQAAQANLIDGPVMDSTTFGLEETQRSKGGGKFNRSIFTDFK